MQKFQKLVSIHRGKMKTYVMGEPLERISLDILGPVSQTYNGNKYILVVTDYFTRFAEAYNLHRVNKDPSLFGS
jgi:hypothetical protein